MTMAVISARSATAGSTPRQNASAANGSLPRLMADPPDIDCRRVDNGGFRNDRVRADEASTARERWPGSYLVIGIAAVWESGVGVTLRARL
jgi:hypothetical protein